MSPGHDEYKGVERLNFQKCQDTHIHNTPVVVVIITQTQVSNVRNTTDKTRQDKTKYRCTTQPVLTHRCIGRYIVQVVGKGNLIYFYYTVTVADTVRIL